MGRVIRLIAITGMTAVTGCHKPVVAPTLWVMDHRSPDPQLDAGRELRAGVYPSDAELSAAINETVSFVFAIRSEQEDLEYPEIRASEFRALGARIDDSAVEIFRMHPVRVDRLPGWHIRSIPPSRRRLAPLDVLVPIHAPRGGLPRVLERGATYYFWVDVVVPKGATATTYTGDLGFFSKGEGIASFPIELTVWPLVLPDDSDPIAIAEVDHVALFQRHLGGSNSFPTGLTDWREHPARSDYDALLRSTLRTLQQHRLTPVLHRFDPQANVSSRGELSVDWSHYDQVVEPLLDGRAFANRAPLRVWPVPIHAMFSSWTPAVEAPSPGTQRLLRDYLSACAAHFASRGWLDRAYALAPSGWPPSRQSFESFGHFASLVSAADARLPVATRLFPQDLAAFGWPDYPTPDFSSLPDIWIPPAQFFDPEVMGRQRGAGKRTWLGVDRPPFSGTTSIHAPPAYVDVLSWQTLALDAGALWMGCVNHWPDDVAVNDPEGCLAFDPGVLLLPGTPFGLVEPVQTTRLKRLRDSQQAAAFVQLLNQHGLAESADALQRSLVHRAGAEAQRTHFADGREAGWPDQRAPFDWARRIMAGEMLATANPKPQGDRMALQDREIEWKRFRSLTESVHLRGDGARVRLSGHWPALSAVVEFWFSITNDTKDAVGAELVPLEITEGWTPLAQRKPVGPLASNASRVTALSIQRDAERVTEFWPGLFVAGLDRPDGPQLREAIRAATAVAAPIALPPEIDGDLTDWPPESVNVLAEFLLITGSSMNASESGMEDASNERPSARTLAFTLRDDAFLYVAVNAEATSAEPVSGSRRSSVRYDDMVPTDEEDLVELLIDPLNGATRSPADLFHIVVKRSGTYLAERGIGFDPPCGARSPWPADVDVATRDGANRWTAELRIPLAAFGVGAAHGEVWGFNVTRWDPRAQEFSTWSGAVGNPYDPLSLGNLFLP